LVIIVCVDDNNGMMFNHRRQSKDQAVLNDIAMYNKYSRLNMNEYTYKLFENMALTNVVITPEFLQQADKGDYCFVEDISILPFKESMEQLIIYKWNRKYPADFYFDIALAKELRLSEIKEFTGTSHNNITKEIYLR
jgi:hypothetical protein